MNRFWYVVFLPLLAMMVLLSCATTAEKAEQQAAYERAVAEALADRHFKIDIQSMHPNRMGSQQMSYGFSLEVKGDTLVSYLPYFGEVYRAILGGGKGLNFTERMSSYQEKQKKKGLRRIEIGVRNEEDSYLYVIEVFSNGRASIDVLAHERERISYMGEMVFDKDR